MADEWDADDFNIDDLQYDENKNLAAAENQAKSVSTTTQEQQQSVEAQNKQPKPSNEKTIQNKKKAQQINQKIEKIQKKYDEDPFGGLIKATQKPTYQDKKRAEEISKMQDAKIMADLFVGDQIDPEKIQSIDEEKLAGIQEIPLNSDKDYELFAKALSIFLSNPKNSAHALKCVEQILIEVYESLSSDQYSKLLSKVKIAHSEVQKQELAKKQKKSTKKQNTLNTGKSDNKILMGTEVEEEDEEEY